MCSVHYTGGGAQWRGQQGGVWCPHVSWDQIEASSIVLLKHLIREGWFCVLIVSVMVHPRVFNNGITSDKVFQIRFFLSMKWYLFESNDEIQKQETFLILEQNDCHFVCCHKRSQC